MNVGDAKIVLGVEGEEKVNKALGRVGNSLDKMSNTLRIAGAGFTAVGAAGLKMASDARQLNATLSQTAINLDVSTKEMRDLALSITNVTFPLESVTATFDLLARAGVKSTAEMERVALAFDTLGDATGSSADEVASNLIPAMKTFNLTADEMAGKVDMFTYLNRKTTLSLEDFNTMVGYTTPELVEMGLTVDDLAAAIIHMEKEGYAPGRVMTREFMKATTAAKEEQIPLTEALGMTSSELEIIKGELAGATGMTDEYAAAANEQYGVLDKLKQKYQELTLVMGSFLTPLEPILTAMTAMGPVMLFLSTSAGRAAVAFGVKAAATLKSHAANLAHIRSSAVLSGALTAEAGAAGAATKAQVGLNIAMLANPVTAIIAGIAALVTALVLMWKNWETVSLKMEKAWLGFKNLIGLGTPTTQARQDALELEESWINVRKKVEDAYSTMVSEVEMATETVIRNAEAAATAEINSLQQRADFYREKHYEKMDMIDEEMMAEINALNPVLAAQLDAINAEMGDLDESEKKREEQAKKDRIRSLKKQLKDDDLSHERKRSLERELEAAEEAAEKERLIEERNRLIAEANLDQKLETEIEVKEEGLAETKRIYNDELATFKEMNTEKLADVEAFVKEYNRILSGAEMKPGTKLELPILSAPESTRENKPFYDSFLDWFPSFQYGGIVPGPAGQPVPIIAHGGEQFLGVGEHVGNVTVNVQGSVITERELVDSIRNGLLKVQNRNYSLGFT